MAWVLTLQQETAKIGRGIWQAITHSATTVTATERTTTTIVRYQSRSKVLEPFWGLAAF